jgi:hypothetical protein
VFFFSGDVDFRHFFFVLTRELFSSFFGGDLKAAFFLQG